MTSRMHAAMLRDQETNRNKRLRELYPRDNDSASQLPPRRGRRRKEFSAPLRRDHRRMVIGWGFA